VVIKVNGGRELVLLFFVLPDNSVHGFQGIPQAADGKKQTGGDTDPNHPVAQTEAVTQPNGQQDKNHRRAGYGNAKLRQPDKHYKVFYAHQLPSAHSWHNLLYYTPLSQYLQGFFENNCKKLYQFLTTPYGKKKIKKCFATLLKYIIIAKGTKAGP
jgi:hypothetical protein